MSIFRDIMTKVAAESGPETKKFLEGSLANDADKLPETVEELLTTDPNRSTSMKKSTISELINKHRLFRKTSGNCGC